MKRKLRITLTKPIIGIDALKEEERIDNLCDGLTPAAAELVRGIQYMKFKKEEV